MSNPWNYQRDYAEGDALAYYLKHDGWIHGLVFDAPSKVCEHFVEAKRTKEKRGKSVLWDRTFTLVPEVFLGSEPKGIVLDTKVLLDEGMYLCYEGKNRQHLFQSVYLSARDMAERHHFMVYFWCHEQVLYVLVFAKQQLRFANMFHVKGASEVLYFVLAAAQECGIHQEKFSIIGDGDASFIGLVDVELEKLGLTMTSMNRSLLYSGYFSSPFQEMSMYLYQMPQCALPEEY